MTCLSRSQALTIWHQVASGLLYEGRKDPGGPPSKEHEDAIYFLTKIANEIIKADESSAQERPRSMLKALQLEGRLDPDEFALKKALSVIEDFGPVKGAKSANLVRAFINSTTRPSGQPRNDGDRDDAALNRKLRTLKKRKYGK